MISDKEYITLREKTSRSGWILSFGDIMTLLLTFFIMMIAMQSGEISRIHKWTNDRLDDSESEIRKIIRDNNLKSFSVHRHSKGVQITISGRSLFNLGEAEPLPGLHEQLTEISKDIRNLKILNLEESEYRRVISELKENNLSWNVEIRVEGHTDNVPLGPNIRYRDNWELSAARAQHVMRILQVNTGIPEKKFAVAGYGEYKPVADNSTEYGRNLNRRVEIYIDASIQKIQ